MKKFIALFALVANTAFAGSYCPDLYPNRTAFPEHNSSSVELCNSFFVSIYDTLGQRVLLVSEKMPKDAGSVKRKDSFRQDGRLGFNSPKPSQYVGTNFDKGHMVPADDASTEKEMYDTFLMTNMTPQEPTLNRVSWKQLEEGVRKDAKKAIGDVWVVTIADYKGSTKLMNGIPVPVGYWKVVYINSSEQWYYAENKPRAVVMRVGKEVITNLY